jgi:hypothetical protein
MKHTWDYDDCRCEMPKSDHFAFYYKEQADELKAERDRLLRDIGLIGAMCGRHDAPIESHAILRQILGVVKESTNRESGK